MDMNTPSTIAPYDAVVVDISDGLGLGEPHSYLKLPGQTWSDFFACILLSMVAPFQNLVNYPPSNEPNKIITKIRKMIQSTGPNGEKNICQQWSANSNKNCAGNTNIVQVHYTIPRRAILQEWGLVDEVLFETNKMPPGDIDVLFRFPASAYTGTIVAAEVNAYGCVSLEKSNFDLRKLKTNSVPLVVYFHGGGLLVGNNHEKVPLEMASELSKLGSNIILASASYALAPEHAFPAAACDACTTVSHLLDRVPKEHKIHIAGTSGGTQPAAVSAFECFRKYPDRIASCNFMLPMLNPAADSFAHYMNRDVGIWLTTGGCRWIWCVYLGLPFVDQDPRLVVDKSQRLDHGSNRDAWETWCTKHRGRLVNPALELPKGLDGPDAPTFLIHTNTGDCQRDDGAVLVEKLRAAGARVKHNEDPGTHWLGTKVGVKGGMDKLMSEWRDMLAEQVTK